MAPSEIEFDEEEFKKVFKKPLIKYSDMKTEMGNEVVEICTMALDEFQSNAEYENAAVFIKNALDKKFEPTWQVGVGEGFGFNISCTRENVIHLYYGNVGVLCYKS